MGTIRNLARQGKDLAVSKALETMGQRHVERFGTIVKAHLDSTNREIRLELLLKGETEPVEVHIRGYEIVAEGDRRFLVARDIEVSREWMAALAREYLAGRRFEIPGSYSKVLELLA